MADADNQVTWYIVRCFTITGTLAFAFAFAVLKILFAPFAIAKDFEIRGEFIGACCLAVQRDGAFL